MKFKVSILPAIDKETIIDITKNSVSPLARQKQIPMQNSKSTEKLAQIKFIASRRKSISKSQNLLKVKN